MFFSTTAAKSDPELLEQNSSDYTEPKVSESF